LLPILSARAHPRIATASAPLFKNRNPVNRDSPRENTINGVVACFP